MSTPLPSAVSRESRSTGAAVAKTRRRAADVVPPSRGVAVGTDDVLGPPEAGGGLPAMASEPLRVLPGAAAMLMVLTMALLVLGMTSRIGASSGSGEGTHGEHRWGPAGDTATVNHAVGSPQRPPENRVVSSGRAEFGTDRIDGAVAVDDEQWPPLGILREKLPSYLGADEALRLYESLDFVARRRHGTRAYLTFHFLDDRLARLEWRFRPRDDRLVALWDLFRQEAEIQALHRGVAGLCNRSPEGPPATMSDIRRAAAAWKAASAGRDRLSARRDASAPLVGAVDPLVPGAVDPLLPAKGMAHPASLGEFPSSSGGFPAYFQPPWPGMVCVWFDDDTETVLSLASRGGRVRLDLVVTARASVSVLRARGERGEPQALPWGASVGEGAVTSNTRETSMVWPGGGNARTKPTGAGAGPVKPTGAGAAPVKPTVAEKRDGAPQAAGSKRGVSAALERVVENPVVAGRPDDRPNGRLETTTLPRRDTDCR